MSVKVTWSRFGSAKIYSTPGKYNKNLHFSSLAYLSLLFPYFYQQVPRNVYEYETFLLNYSLLKKPKKLKFLFVFTYLQYTGNFFPGT